MMHYLRTFKEKDQPMKPVAACGARLAEGDKLSGFASKVDCPECRKLPAVSGPAQQRPG